MSKLTRIYVDTSVIGGCFDAEFALWSRGLFRDFRIGRFMPVVSGVVTAEIAEAPPAVRRAHAELLELGAESLSVGPEALELARRYEDRGILGARHRVDMLHIALATVARTDALVSWNFRHVVRMDRIRLVHAVNLECGYTLLPIHSPREVTTHGKSESHSDR